MALAEGGCVCREIRYAVKSPPIRVTICHCKFCQRATGSAYLVEPIFTETDFELLSGTPTIYQQLSEGSGKTLDVHFCQNCGTKLFNTFERFPGVVGVFGGTFDDPNWFERTPDNTRHIFVAVAQTGTVIPAGLKTFEEHATRPDGSSAEPTVYTEPRVIGQSR